ncbi:MAG: Vms1/Ankzf1 family peptidyl-tRNA hydrolase, partial [Methanothrix soehngenii]
MVDLFGKKKLEDRISELEEAIAVREREKEELVRTLQKREEKIKRLASANQEVNLALKAMEQKTATMVTSSPEKMETERPKARLPEAWMPDNRELDLLIQRLQGFRSPREDLLVYAFPGSLPEDADIPPQIRRAAMEIKTHRGGIIIYCPQLFALQFIPPFPIKERGSWEGSSFQLSLIEEMMNTPALVVSAHAGSTFLGVALSREGFAVHEKVETQVKEKHSKGGWSQKRFERLREEDI